MYLNTYTFPVFSRENIVLKTAQYEIRLQKDADSYLNIYCGSVNFVE